MEAYGQVKGRKYPSNHKMEHVIQTKLCLKCGRELPLSEFRFQRGSYRSPCKECNRKKWREQKRENAQKFKTCPKCGKELTWNDFYLRGGKPMPPCKACRSVDGARYRERKRNERIQISSDND